MAGMGMATGLVRLGAGAATAGDEGALGNLRSGAWLLTTVLGGIAFALMAIFRTPLSEWALGSPDHSWDMLLMGIALWFTIAMNVQNGLLNASHRVEALAAFGVLNSVLTATSSIACVWIWHSSGVVPAILGTAVTTWAASRWLLTRNVPRGTRKPSWRDTLRSARALLVFGAPFTASSTVGTGVQLALPIVVLHLLNTEAVAYYKASAAISVGYLGFLVTAMGQDYYPRLAAVRKNPRAMLPLIHEQYRLVMLLAAPIVLFTLAVVPYLVPIIYSRRFMATTEILEWQLIGDLFKFSSWTMSFAILARCSPVVYIATETVGGALVLSTAWLGARFYGVAGLGIGFVVTYAVYYLVVRTVLRREVPMRETAENVRLLMAALAAAVTIRILPATPLAPYRTPIALALATAFAAYSARALWGEYAAGRIVRRRAVTAV